MELIDHIDELFIDVQRIPDYWITDRLDTELKGHASTWYTGMKKSMAEEAGHGGRVKKSKSTAMVLGYGKIPCHFKMKNTLWTKIHMNDEIANTLHNVRKRTNIGKYSQYRSSSFKKKQPFRVDFKNKPKGRVADMTKKKNSCHNCGSTDHYANNYPTERKKVYAIEKFPEKEPSTGDYDSDSMGDSIREPSDYDQDPKAELVETWRSSSC
ncbi:hypothetical protein O181_049221 [Austropuccinia psidii MF-1]|uniref:Uncharacterized protein n=1 Tax=Austropuccinia psidii MF-1 TaxID=1389203 RepID=A0A9Q3DS07_9BASI|nr:hypothetical protein [Austropuccinia psidii MF-1]